MRSILLTTIIALAAIAVSAQSYDLAVTDIATTPDNKVAVTVANLGRSPLPATVYTTRGTQAPTVSIRVNGNNWGGMAIWAGDPDRKLMQPGGRHVFIMKFAVRGEVAISATVNVNGLFTDANAGNNVMARTLRPGNNATATTGSVNAKGSFLSSGSNFDLDKIKTIHSMQEHIQWVSTTNEAEATRQLQQNGFTVLGGGFITEGGILGERLRAYVVTKGDAVVVAFRGTKAVGRLGQTTVNAVATDGNIVQVTPGFFRSGWPQNAIEQRSKVHMGFNRAYMQMRPEIMRALQGQQGKRIFAFGHSLGGALATLFAADIALNEARTFAGVTHIVSGSPRVGDETFRKLSERLVPNNLRFQINRDPIATIPNFISLKVDDKYQHVGRLLVVGRDDSVIVRGEDIDLTFDLIQFGYHDNEKYLEAAKRLMDRAASNSSIYGRGNSIVVETGDKERERSNRMIRRF